MGEKKLVIGGRKKCGSCSIVKLVSEFYTHGRHRHDDGVAGWCKLCRITDERRRRLNPVLIERFRNKYESDMNFRARELLRAIGKRARANKVAFNGNYILDSRSH